MLEFVKVGLVKFAKFGLNKVGLVRFGFEVENLKKAENREVILSLFQ